MSLRLAVLAAALSAACAPAKVAWSEAAPARPEVFVDVLPRNAEVRVDGALAGEGPLALKLDAPSAALEVSASGFEPARLKVEARQAGGRVGVVLRPSGFGEARRLDIDDPSGLAIASAWLLRAGKPAEAASYAERGVEVAPSAPLPRRALGLALARLGKRSRAAQELSSYLQFSPGAADRAEIEGLVARLRKDIAFPEPRD